MAIRKIVKFDEEKCNGCGLCVPACAEGALKIIDGKARLISDKYCDGLGACLGKCPRGAITIIEREADEFNEEAVKQHLGINEDENHQRKTSTRNTNSQYLTTNGNGISPSVHDRDGFSCPGSRMMDIRRETIGSSCPGSRSMDLRRGINSVNDSSSSGPKSEGQDEDMVEAKSGDVKINIRSQLIQWPVQLMLVPVEAPYFDGADLLITADCVAVAYPNYHLGLLKGKAVVMGCPKLDDGNYYIEKLAEIIKNNDIKSITVAHMEVPCCYGMVKIAQAALVRSGKNIPLKTVEISVEGKVI